MKEPRRKKLWKCFTMPGPIELTGETMRAAVYYSNSDVRIEDRPIPKIGPAEALIQVEVSGICGSDVMERYRRPRARLVLGHEISGRVVAIEGIPQFKEGDR